LEATISLVFKREFQAAVAVFDQQIRDVLRFHEERADGLIESVQKTAAELFGVSFQPAQHLSSFESGRTPYWLTHRWDRSFGPISPSLIDKVLPRTVRERRLERRYRDKVDGLVITNAGKLREALSDQIDVAFTRFARQFDERIASALAATHGAMRTGLIKREELSALTAEDARRLEQTIEELAALMEPNESGQKVG
jgi:hypothetical protein